NPLSPPFAPVQRRLQSPPSKSKFLAVKALAMAVRNHETSKRHSGLLARLKAASPADDDDDGGSGESNPR
ncbi:MAG: hypothetical protein OSA43_06465, partial [Pirellulales bacterium]|nr:hypothetical protein [Pirellulales bacterium]